MIGDLCVHIWRWLITCRIKKYRWKLLTGFTENSTIRLGAHGGSGQALGVLMNRTGHSERVIHKIWPRRQPFIAVGH